MQMPYVGIIIVFLGLFLFIYCLVYFLKGRKANRGLAITNGLAGLFAALMYSIFLYDTYIFDILSNETIRAYCMRPITVVMLGAMLANVLHMRWSDELG